MSRYDKIENIIREGQPLRGTTIYKTVEESPEDYYVITTVGDRFDILANEFYRDSSLWYIIAAANPTVRRDTLFIEPGFQIRIPMPLSRVLTAIDNENANR